MKKLSMVLNMAIFWLCLLIVVSFIGCCIGAFTTFFICASYACWDEPFIKVICIALVINFVVSWKSFVWPAIYDTYRQNKGK